MRPTVLVFAIVASLGLSACASEEEQACIDGGGEWGPNHCNNCFDMVQGPNGPSFKCTADVSDGCSCGDGQCWDGEACVEY